MNKVAIPPGKYFISHSYKDADVRDKMIEQLSDHIEAFIFPPIDVPPEQFVSNNLLEAIRGCTGLIFLNGGYSSNSFWVAFEREYAIRIKKPVFMVTYLGSDGADLNISRYEQGPLELNYSFVFSHQDYDTRSRIMSTVFDHLGARFFSSPIIPAKFSKMQYPVETVRRATHEALLKKGFLIVFWSINANHAHQFERDRLYKEISFGIESAGRDNILLVMLDDTSFPENLQNHPDKLVVNLNEGAFHHRVDDLIVRLYWLTFRNQFPELVYE